MKLGISFLNSFFDMKNYTAYPILWFCPEAFHGIRHDWSIGRAGYMGLEINGITVRKIL